MRIAVIGLGSRVTGMLKKLINNDPSVELVALADPNPQAVRERLKKREIEAKNIRHFQTAEQLLEHASDFDGIMIGTRCQLHACMAAQVAPTGLPLFLEKPVAVTREQLAQLTAAYEGRPNNVVVSFPLRLTPLLQAAIEVVRSGRLGPINQVQAVNNVSYGGVYFGQWYRNYEETGGLWLQKATHDFDYINQLVNSDPYMVAATATQRVYGGDKPHDLHCSKCDEVDTCIESGKHMKIRGNDGGMAAHHEGAEDWDHACPFSREIKNQDCGSAMIMYANGVHAAYSQNFVSRLTSRRRGATVTGHRGSLQFDWTTESMTIYEHHQHRVEEIKIQAGSGHGGGDDALARNFIDIMRGKAESLSNLHDGLLSAQMCLAARESCETRAFVPVTPVFTKRAAESIPLPIGG